jgi:predicted heme/steroid binding protein
MNMSSKSLTILSLVGAAVLVGGATVLTRQKPAVLGDVTLSREVPSRTVLKSELANADGKNGQLCYVAVDAVVYQIKNEPDWRNGQHTTSGGRAYCGADMSRVIDKAPHGRKILDQLPIIGSLAS